MIAALKIWFAALSQREQRMVGVAGVLAALVVLIFGIILPSLSAIKQAEIAHDEAVQRRGRIEATVDAALAQKPAASIVSGANIEHLHDAIARLGGNELEAILAKSESGAAFMADAHARVHRTLGVCCATSGGGGFFSNCD